MLLQIVQCSSNIGRPTVLLVGDGTIDDVIVAAWSLTSWFEHSIQHHQHWSFLSHYTMQHDNSIQ